MKAHYLWWYDPWNDMSFVRRNEWKGGSHSNLLSNESMVFEVYRSCTSRLKQVKRSEKPYNFSFS